MSKYIKLEDAIEAVTSIFRVSALFSGINDNEDVWREKAEKVLAKCEVVTGTAKQGLEHIEVSEDCIDRKALLERIKRQYGNGWQFFDIIENAPSVVPSRATGKWYIKEYDFFTCDQCEESVYNGAECTQEAREMLKTGDFPSYCENCGARMESDEE